MLILVVNCGSSSVKYQARDTSLEGEKQVLAKGLIEEIGTKISDHTEALAIMAEQLKAPLHGRTIDAIGHRVVQGGDIFTEPVLIDEKVLQQIDDLSPLAPLHNPAHVLGIKAATETYPGVPQVAVFDNAFHSTMPEHVYRYAVPHEFYDKYAVRRYGAHGTSHDYVTGVAAELLGIERDNFNAVIAHLGNGASMTAVKNGKCYDTSMGYTPLAGLIMGTRCGDIDPSVLTIVQQRGNISAEEMDRILNKESGLKGLTGHSDMREVENAAEAGDENAKLALDMVTYRIAQYVGSYHVAVGGAQALVFTAGIGENSHVVRSGVAERLGALGVKLDEGKNSVRSPEPRVISTEDSAMPVLVVPTNEELAIAIATEDIVSGR